MKRLARRLKKTESEIVRSGLDAILEEQETSRRREKAMSELLAYASQRMAKGPLPGRRDWTREDIYDDATSSFR